MPLPQGYVEDSPTAAAPTFGISIPKGYAEDADLSGLPATINGSESGSPFVDALYQHLTSGSPLNPHNWIPMLKNAFSNPYSAENFDQAEKLITASEKRGNILPILTGKEDGTLGEYGGGLAGDAANAAIIGAMAHGLSNLGGHEWPEPNDTFRKADPAYAPKLGLRTPDPDGALINAIKPYKADTGFAEAVPDIRASVKRGETLTGTKITDVPSAIKAVEASQQEYMDALETQKEAARVRGDVMPTSMIKANAIKALPTGLEVSNPAEYNAAVEEIHNLFPRKDYLNVDEVFDQSHLNNAKLSRFHASPEAAQNSKMITNGGDTATLKAVGDTYRQWINDHMGALASDNNSHWGDLNGFKHYLQDRANAADLQHPITGLGRIADKLGMAPDPALFNPKSILSGVVRKMLGQPTSIDDLLKSAFENSDAAMAPPEANRRAYNDPGNPARQLPAGTIYGGERGDAQGIRGTPQPEDTSYVRGVPGMYQPPNPARALPPATTILQGDVGPGSGGGVGQGWSEQTGDTSRVLPTRSDASYVEGRPGAGFGTESQKLIRVNDQTAAHLFRGKAYSELGSRQRAIVDKVVGGGALNLQDMMYVGQ